MALPARIQTREQLRDAIERHEALAGVLDMHGHPLALLPEREEIAHQLRLAAGYMRQTFDPQFVREFHDMKLRRVG